MINVPAVQPIYRSIDSTFYGLSIHLAVLGGDSIPTAISANSIQQALKDEYSEAIRMFIHRSSFSAPLVYNGREQIAGLIMLKPFFSFCMMHKSPRLDAFREHLSEIAMSVHEKGAYIAPGAGPTALLSDRQRNDPMSQQLAMLIQLRDAALALESKVEEIERKADAALQLHSGEPDEFALKGWCKINNVNLPESVLGKIGFRLTRVCRDRGITLSKVRDRKFGDVNCYPRVLLEELIPNGKPAQWLVAS